MKKYLYIVLALTLMPAAGAHAGAGGPYSDQRLSRSNQLIFMEEAYGVGVEQGRQLTADQVDAVATSAEELRRTARTLDERSGRFEDAAGRVVAASDQAALAAKRVEDQQQDHAARMERFDGQLSRSERKIDVLGRVDNAMVDTAHLMLSSAELVASERKNSAEIEAERRIQEARREAERVVSSARESAYDEQTDYQRVMNERVSCHFREALIAEVFACLTPEGWTPDIEVKDQSFIRSMMSFTSEKPRRMAISDLVEQVRIQTSSRVDLSVNFYPRIKDELGEPHPLVVFSDGVTPK